MGITAHWIDDNWEIQQLVLDFVDVSKIIHTGANLASKLEKTTKDLAVQHKLLGIVTDNATNNDTLFETMVKANSSIGRLRCFGHILNLIVQDALTHIGDAIVSLRDVVKKIKNSSQKLSKLEDFCQSCRIKLLCPILDVPTRWNSTYAMIKRALEIRMVRIQKQM